MVNYRTAYNRLISQARKRMLSDGIVTKRQILKASGNEVGLQIHHVKPKKFGGLNLAQNLVLLSKNEHRWAHMLLNLALYQEKNFSSLRKLNYANTVVDLPRAFKRKNALKDLKLELHVSEKFNRQPITMSFAKAIEFFTILLKRDADNLVGANELAKMLFRKALFRKQFFGYTLGLHMQEKEKKKERKESA